MAELISLRDFEYLLYDVLNVEQLCESERFSEYGREDFDAILEAAKQLAEETFETHSALLDQDAPTLEDGVIHIIPQVKAATDAYVEGGYSAGPFPEEWGGLGLPATICNAYTMMFNAADISTSTYVGLTMAATHMLMAHGDDALKAKYLEPMVAGAWFGTMCLSEPHAGSSLANIRTTATPLEDGSYSIKGSKMWITGGDHELSENIIHFVLARLPDSPVGTRGISLFVVPKYHVGDDGELGERNDVRLVGLNHKMGYRGSVNAVMEFGDSSPCIGYMVGAPHQGLRYMFHMMNEARVGTGLASAATAYAGLRHAVDYARERPQGFKPGQRDQSQPEVMIIEHADVRRMLLHQKAIVEGSLHLIGHCSLLMDKLELAKEAGSDEAHALDMELALLTPIAKGWVTEHCLDANRLAIQVLGGAGYTHDYPVERLYRDNQLNTIVEGTTGIQAMDLLGRKVTMMQGAAMQHMVGRMQDTLRRAGEFEALKPHCDSLTDAIQKVSATTMGLMGEAMGGQIEKFLANATPYMFTLGHTVIAWLWLEQGIVLQQKLQESPDSGYYLGKQKAMEYFYAWELPRIEQWLKVLQPVDTTCLEMQPDWF